MITAHVAGLPLEEVLPAMAGGAAGLAVARSWVMVRLRRRRDAEA